MKKQLDKSRETCHGDEWVLRVRFGVKNPDVAYTHHKDKNNDGYSEREYVEDFIPAF